MGSLASYLPPHLVRSLSTNGPPARLPHVERFPAALLFSDISGFTALTERLQARGREGAEEIAAAVGTAFAPAIRAIERNGGSIVSFGGDALFAIFPDASAVHGAHGAAEAIQGAFAGRGEIATSAGQVRLGISQAVHHGDVVGLHLGSEERRHYLVTGPAVTALARLEARASAGKLLLSPEARRRLKRERTTSRPRPPRSSAAVLRPYLEPRLLPLLGKFEGEYRRVAVLFLETKVDRPAALQSFYLALVQALDRTEGVLLKTDLSSSGTKWICAFGIPQAHEEDPDRAALAALDVLGQTPRSLGMRGGLHAGVVANIVVGPRSRRCFDVMGDVVNTAARGLVQARWGEVLVTEDTRKLLAGVDTKPRGKRAVKGKSTALELHAVKVARAVIKQIRVSAPMIGRDQELATIVGALQRAKAGEGSVIGIKGEPGIGKSRLKYEAAMVARGMGFAVHEGQAISFGGTAYGTIGALLRDALALSDVPEKQAVLEKVAEAATRLDMDAVNRHHVADVLGARYSDSPIEHLRPEDVRLNDMIAIRALLQALAREKPRLVVLEDMHWADGASSEAAEWLAKGAAEARFVMLLLYRPGYAPPDGTNELLLGELAERAAGELLEAHLGKVPDKVAVLVKERAGGNPFYVEQVVRHMLEVGILGHSDEGYQFLREPRPEDLPASVESVTAARLDRLSVEARKVAQVGAVIGRRFLFELLAHLEEVSRHARPAVDELTDREVVFEWKREPHLEYIFKHAITRDVAYSSILAARRRALHGAVARALEALFPDDDAFLAMLGFHNEQAGERERARECYLAGARQAAGRHAHEEAERLYRSYRALVEEPTAESITARNELAEVLKTRGRMGEAEGESRRALGEAREIGEGALEAASLRDLAVVHMATGRMEEAQALYNQALAAVREVGDRRSEGSVLGNLAVLHHERGQMKRARVLYDQALAIHRQERDRPPEGYVLGNLANLHQAQGRMEEALAHYGQALAIAREVGDKGFEGIVLGNLALLLEVQGRMEEARDHYERALAIHREVGDRRSEGHVLGNLAGLHHEQSRLEEARELYEQALAIHRQVGDRRFQGISLCNLANLRRDQGEMDEVGAIYGQALAVARDVGDRQSEGWVLRDVATAELLAEPLISRARDRYRQAEAALAQVGDRLNMSILRCTGGHIALAEGKDPTEELRRAREVAESMSAGAESQLGKAIGKLERAASAFRAGRPLIRGHGPEDLTSGQLRWLHAHRPEAIPPEVMARLNEDGTLRPEEPMCSDLRDLVAKRAYELWELSGRRPDHELDNWLEAEREVQAGAGHRVDEE